ncbi:heparin lyase I family protein [Chryseobacterium sp. c4a]|uniref:heparin lyase I family protein n=1 Tax=Chryseobacterium sp. c4a TaxID=1573582 RepID=UPI001358CD32|nr:heparin lyase I family protein [Chryseobacterium sp. c4a]
MINPIKLNWSHAGRKRAFLLLATMLSGSYTNAQSVGDVLLNINYENGTPDSGITGLNVTNATAADAAYIVQPGATGNHAIAHKVVYGDSGYYSNENWRSESSTNQYRIANFYPGDERRYEFSVLLKDWTPWKSGDPTNETNIFQLKMSGGAGVPLQVRTQRNAMRLRFAIDNNVPPVDIIPDVRPYVNQWIHFRIDVKWADTAIGYMKTYMKLPNQINYVLVDDKTNYTTYNKGPVGGDHGYIKWGVYVTPPDITRIVYHDDIKVIYLGGPAVPSFEQKPAEIVYASKTHLP